MNHGDCYSSQYSVKFKKSKSTTDNHPQHDVQTVPCSVTCVSPV